MFNYANIAARTVTPAQRQWMAEDYANDNWHERQWLVWYDNGTGYYDCADWYTAPSADAAIALARSDGLQWCADIIVSDEDPNTTN